MSKGYVDNDDDDDDDDDSRVTIRYDTIRYDTILEV
jgi:hypothetical protein